ncbi:MerR family transcriptional regulator [Weissella diestrammenae]|uniref:MerR family transcriptional regulator n=1 Tax=Weissella diestrammenae TaxID=1162633 RepID=A0A7G9T574_9LACO|nr:MerR family transcriptional regulator [Weissella diestrammenae]MCM0583105.1 MerR family transcriptional regulator [Weissella diestrammenae]QNN75249.1 MerR family transcriptional regulator [Weissella diestrammenae]
MNIKEASELTGVESSTIRYYEQVGLIPTVDRKPSGVRDFDEFYIRRITFAKNMRSAGMSIDAIKRYVELVDDTAQHEAEQKAILVEQIGILKEKRDDLEATIGYLQFKVDHFYDHMLDAEEQLKLLEKQHEMTKRNQKEALWSDRV